MLLPDSASPDPNKNYKIQNDCNLPKDIFPENYVTSIVKFKIANQLYWKRMIL